MGKTLEELEVDLAEATAEWTEAVDEARAKVWAEAKDKVKALDQAEYWADVKVEAWVWSNVKAKAEWVEADAEWAKAWAEYWEAEAKLVKANAKYWTLTLVKAREEAREDVLKAKIKALKEQDK